MYASHMYLESKCNVNFDAEKVRHLTRRCDIANALEQQHDIINVQSGYFVPVRDIPVEIAREYTNLGICIFGVSDLYRWFNDELPFTIDEYFKFLSIGWHLSLKHYSMVDKFAKCHMETPKRTWTCYNRI